MKPKAIAAMASQLSAWRKSPSRFVRECLGETPDAWQDEVLMAYEMSQRVALKSNKGSGKTTLLAWIACHFLTTRPHPKIVATSISGDNLRDGMWTEMARYIAKSDWMRVNFAWTKERIVAKQHPETWWMAARQWSKDADTTAQAHTLAGIHADYVLFLLDEVGGIPDGVMAAAEAGLSTGRESKLVIAGNPTHLSGPLYRACTTERHLWYVKEITGDPDDPMRAPRVDIGWAREQIEKYGRDSAYVMVNVFGRFPPAQSNALLGIEEVTASSKRTIGAAEYIYAPKVVGVDVARFGDDRSVIAMRQGRAAYKMKTFRDLDTMELAGQVAFFVDEHKPAAVFVDVTGVGAGVVDRLHQLGHNAIGVEFGGKALRAEPKCINRRTEMWVAMARWLRDGGCIPADNELIGELVAPTYGFDDSGRYRLEKKEEMKRRGVPSPDKADALALTFAAPVAAPALIGSHYGVERTGRAVTDYDIFGGFDGR